MDRGGLPSARSRSIDLETWSNASVPPLRDPRELVVELHQRHLPPPGTTVIGVLDHDHRVVASASVSTRPQVTDGWQHRNAILGQLRRVIPHDLRLATPRRTAVLLHCREGALGWIEQDGAWMWALRDAASLHGLRCGAYVTLTPAGWQVIGDGRIGRSPHSGSWAGRPLHAVSELPQREPRAAAAEPTRAVRPWYPIAPTGPEHARRAAH
ncbi:hypothetical protein [Kitasatospora sp. MAP12-44]|uniref:hypothetical protein n=1 Tax=Kitasatospora sp. MAP12-44 TaxID=3035099 RepID=UPI0024744D6D|nr:hypothetical protein [Kitasatospora sp. MAP12-44]